MAISKFSESINEKLRLIATIVMDGVIAIVFLLVAYAIKWLFDGSDIVGTTIIVAGEIAAVVTFLVLTISEIVQLVTRKRAEIVRCQLDTSREISASQAEINAIISSVDNDKPVEQVTMKAQSIRQKTTDQRPNLQHRKFADEMSSLSKADISQIASGVIRICRQISSQMGVSADNVFIDEARLTECLKRVRADVDSFMTSSVAKSVSIWRFSGILIYWLVKLRPITVLSDNGSQIHPLNELVAHAFALKYLGHVDISKMESYINSQMIWTLQYRTTDPMALGVLYRIIFDQYGDKSNAKT